MKLAVIAGIAPSLVAVASAEVVLINPSADTTLHEAFPANNFGGNDFLVAGTSAYIVPSGNLARTRSLIRFDLAGRLPATANITRARLTVSVTHAPSEIGSTFALSRLFGDPSSPNWDEGSGSTPSGQTALNGEVTWRAWRLPFSLWQEAGALGPNDVAQTPSATTSINQTGAYTFESLNLVADAQGWLTAPSNNFGWVLWGQSADARSGRRFASREAESGKPVLELTYNTMPPELRIIYIGIGNGLVTLNWTGGRAPFRLERRSGIEAPPEILPAQINGNTTSIPVSGEKTFYRIVGSP